MNVSDEAMRSRPDVPDWKVKKVVITDPATGQAFEMPLGTLAQMGFPGDGSSLAAGDVRWARFLEKCGAEGLTEWREISKAEVYHSRRGDTLKGARLMSAAEAMKFIQKEPDKAPARRPRHLWSAKVDVEGGIVHYTRTYLTQADSPSGAARKVEDHVREEVEHPPGGLPGEIDYRIRVTELSRVALDRFVCERGPNPDGSYPRPGVYSIKGNPGPTYYVVAGHMPSAIEYFWTLKLDQPMNLESVEEFRQLHGTYIY